jgi:hypothetical protein
MRQRREARERDRERERERERSCVWWLGYRRCEWVAAGPVFYGPVPLKVST